MIKKGFAIALMLIALCACGEKPEDKIVPVASVTLSQPEAEMKVGETLQLKAQISPSNATEQNVVWASSKQSVATVSDAGKVTAVGEGSANITASVDGKSASCAITVTKPEVPVVHVESVTVDKTDAHLQIGQSLELTATVLPDNADDKSVAWKSTNPEIAEVDQSGKVTAISSGTVTITVTAMDGDKVAACEITVSEVFVPVESVTFEHPELIVHKGDSYQINVIVLPENATNKTITWTSSDPSIASISQEGIITGLGDGRVVITAKAGDIEATCDIVAIDDPVIIEDHDGEENGHYWVDLGLPSGIKWATCNVGAASAEDYGGYYAWGETLTKSAYRQENYSVQTKYSAGDDNLTQLLPEDDAAHVVMGGNWFTPTREEMQELLDNCTFERVDMGNGAGYKVVSKKNGKTMLLPAAGSKIFENEEYVGGVFFYWTSSVKADLVSQAWNLNTYNNELVVDGMERFRGCPIRAVTGRAAVPVESIRLNKIQIFSMHPNDRITLVATVLPENAADKSVRWASTNPGIADVDQAGNVTAKSVGTVTITATTTDGGKVAGCEVTVKPAKVAIQSIAIAPSSVSMKVGETVMLKFIVAPPEADVYSTTAVITGDSGVLVFGTDDVSTQKTIVARSPGSAAVTVKVKGAGGEELSATCPVTVTEDTSYIPVDYLEFDQSHIELTIGDIRSLSVMVFPDNATDKTVTWSSSDNRIAKVSASGLLTAVGAGSASIIATADGKSNSFDVTVKSNIVPVESIRLDKFDELLGTGNSLDLTPTVLPSNATNQTVTWSSSDPGVATVDASGHVTAVDAGITEIKAMAGGKETDCRVTVIAVPQRIDLNATQMTLTKGERATLIGTVFPANANDRNVYYYADGSSVVMVGERTGEVYANKLGTAVITAKNISSGITATCSVTVVAAGPAGIILEQNSITVGDAASQDIRVPLQLVNTDGSTLQATDDADWIGTSVVGSSVAFFVAENKSTLSRTATITLTYSSATATVTVTQRGKTPSGPPDIELIVNPDANNGLSSTGGDQGVWARVTNPVEGVQMQLSTDVDWMTNLRSGANDTYYFTTGKNTSGQTRTGHFILTYGSVTKRIKFIQEPVLATIIITPNDVTVNYKAQVGEFNVALPEGFSHDGLTFEPDGNWMSEFTVAGSTVAFRIRENNSGNDRTGRVKVSLGGQSEWFRITQTFDAPEVILPASYKLTYKGQKVVIWGNITNPREEVGFDVRVLNSPGWIYANPGGAFTVTENTTGRARSAQVEISYGNYLKKTLTVTQAASETQVRTGLNEYNAPVKGGNLSMDVLISDPLQYTSLEVIPADPWVELISLKGGELKYYIGLRIRKNYWPVERVTTVTFKYGGFSATLKITQPAGDELPVGFIDLGLPSGTLWALTNLGSSNDYDYGSYYAWGETTAKTSFTWFNYTLGSGSRPWENLGKYNRSDGKKVLEPEDDAATAADAAWSIPTRAQWQELMENCDFEWIQTPVAGVKFTSTVNGESIFLPAAGWKADNDPYEPACIYWSKNLSDDGDSTTAVTFEAMDYWSMSVATRYYGMPIRPVRQR